MNKNSNYITEQSIGPIMDCPPEKVDFDEEHDCPAPEEMDCYECYDQEQECHPMFSPGE